MGENLQRRRVMRDLGPAEDQEDRGKPRAPDQGGKRRDRREPAA
jgi:hypothetical protein